MSRKQKLELNWIGKDERLRLEPRIFQKVSELSYPENFSDLSQGIFDNRLIFGDNLLALKSLEQDFAGQVKCIYIDPPYNIDAATPYYEDGLKHSEWLTRMQQRIESLKILLKDDGLIFVQIDDEEMAYLAVMMDEIFGRGNRLNVITVKMSEVSGVKMSHVDKRLPKLKEYILVYKKGGIPIIDVESVPAESWNEEYKTVLVNISREKIQQLKSLINKEVCTNDDVAICNEILRDAKMETVAAYCKNNGISKNLLNEWRYENAWRIIQAVGSSSVLKLAKLNNLPHQDIGAVLSATGLIYLFKTQFDHDSKQPRVQIIFADDNLMKNPGDFWADIKTTGGVGQEGGVLFPNGKKPEALIKRIIGMCTKPGDLVLDSFLGSGTTAAVAHKMGRRWIGIELGEHCHTHCIPRLKRVIDGEDQGGITSAVNWLGGGGFTYYKLAPSLIKIDKYGQPVINHAYNPEMLSEAVCKLMNFKYSPSDEHYWMHGHSSENDYIFVTTQSLDHEQLRAISEEVGDNKTLLICCKAFRSNNIDAFLNLTVKKIPQSVMRRCEWDKDDYSLNVTSGAAHEVPPNQDLSAEVEA